MTPTHLAEIKDDSQPAWKRHGRNGPFDWWIGCLTHGGELIETCLSCGIAIKHNKEFAKVLERENGK